MVCRMVRAVGFKYLFICVFVTFVVGCILSLVPISSEKCACPKEAEPDKVAPPSATHLLGVVVPFRDRFDELMEFIPHIHKFLQAQNINYHVFVINQVDQYRFNRASLINVGFTVAIAQGCDYIAMHDVDLLPLNQELSYSFPKDGPFHVASPKLHPRYHYDTYVGGIVLINKENFLSVNGMSNKYWGWGKEDDEFYVRLKQAGLNVTRPGNLTTGVQNTFKHIHNKAWRKRDFANCFNQKEATRRRDWQTGLNNVAYTISSKREMSVDGYSATVVNTALRCNRTITPWCLCPEENRVIAAPPRPRPPLKSTA